MELRSVWAQELDEDPVDPGAAGTGSTMIGAVDPPSPAEGEPSAEEGFDEADGRRRGSAVAWLAALTVLALLLMTLGWWLGRGDGPLSPGVSSGAAVTSDTVPAGQGAADGSGSTVAGSGGGTTLSGGGVGTGGDGADGAQGATGSGTESVGVAPGGGTGPGSGSGDGDDDPGSGSGSGSDPAVKADVEAKVDADGVRASVDFGAVTSPGGAVTALTVTACTKLSGLELDATATVRWANGFEETGVKVNGLTLLNLLEPGRLSVKVAGDSFTVPANATVKVGACLSL